MWYGEVWHGVGVGMGMVCIANKEPQGRNSRDSSMTQSSPTAQVSTCVKFHFPVQKWGQTMQSIP